MTGLVREIYQRYDEDRAWYDFGQGSRLDLIFWGIGTAAGILIMILW
jgi:hypothetical protein